MYTLFLIGLLLIVIVGLTLHYRVIIGMKNRSIVRQIKEQDRLRKSMEQLFHKHIVLYNRLKEVENH